jgi:hypothetical protein
MYWRCIAAPCQPQVPREEFPVRGQDSPRRCHLRAEVWEDHNGELYVEAFREYFSGNGKVLYIENDKVLGTDVHDLVSAGKVPGIKDNVTKPLYTEDMETVRRLSSNRS